MYRVNGEVVRVGTLGGGASSTSLLSSSETTGIEGNAGGLDTLGSAALTHAP
jgi:hypothetical protein